jgi:hypothetical protein
MNTNRTYSLNFLTRLSVAATWTAALLLAAAIGGFWLLLSEFSPLAFSLFAGPFVLAAGAGTLAVILRDRARRRLLAALDAYAEREINRVPRWSSSALKPVRTLATRAGMSATVGTRTTAHIQRR